MLEKKDIPFFYEKPLILKGFGRIHPDFTVLNVTRRKTMYWEHLGMMDDAEYLEHALERISHYEAAGIFPGTELILTNETSSRPVRTKIIEKMIEKYLKKSPSLKAVFLLIDIRHEPGTNDRQMYEWIVYYGIPFTLIATKADKIAKTKRQHTANAVAKQLGAAPYAIPYSVETGDGKETLLDTVGQIVCPALMQQEEPNADLCPV